MIHNISIAKSRGSSSPTTEYAYQYDDIGNRITSFDLGTNCTYTANNLNQYTSISNFCGSLPFVALAEEGAAIFTPQFDDGNQTLIKTSTGIWQVTYNGENRPVLWENVSTNSLTPNSSTPSLLSMSYDRMGRRVEYLETVNIDGVTTTNTHHRFVYDGYLCIQRLNAGVNNSIDLIFAWDPAESVATRPLAWLVLRSLGEGGYYTHDGNKNVSDLTDISQSISAHYTYTPFGALLSSSGSSATINPTDSPASMPTTHWDWSTTITATTNR